MPSLGAAEILLCAGIAIVAFFAPLSALVLMIFGREACPRCHQRIPKRSTACPKCRRELPVGWASR